MNFFCVRKTDNKHDECLVAQEQLHPMCAQRVDGAAMPTCHSLAEMCREEVGCRYFSTNRRLQDWFQSCEILFCRVKLELYEQSCAVDSVTKKCAGQPAECRKAMLGILGTSLRSNCACKGTDFSQLYDCLGWQRLLWVNPCVGAYTNLLYSVNLIHIICYIRPLSKSIRRKQKESLKLG